MTIYGSQLEGILPYIYCNRCMTMQHDHSQHNVALLHCRTVHNVHVMICIIDVQFVHTGLMLYLYASLYHCHRPAKPRGMLLAKAGLSKSL